MPYFNATTILRTIYWKEIIDFMKCIDIDNNDNDKDNDIETKNNDDDENKTYNRVLIHCEMGISRSATIVIAYLMYKLKITLFDAYLYVFSRRNVIRPNSSFLKQLELFEKKLFNGKSTLQKVNTELRQIYLQNLIKQQQE